MQIASWLIDAVTDGAILEIGRAGSDVSVDVDQLHLRRRGIVEDVQARASLDYERHLRTHVDHLCVHRIVHVLQLLGAGDLVVDSLRDGVVVVAFCNGLCFKLL